MKRQQRGRIWHRGRDMTKERDQLKFRGSKLINLYGAFECAFHMFACMAQVFNFNIHTCVVYASCKFEWWNENLACICYLVISFPCGIELTMMLRYRRRTFEAWYQSECTNIPSLAPWLAWYHLETLKYKH